MRGAAAVLRCIDDAPQDVGTIAAVLDLHPNTVRKHLEHLQRKGLVSGETERTGRPGRPRRVWHRTAGPVDAYRELALLLVELHRSGQTPIELGRRLGAVETGASDAAEAIVTVSAAHGVPAHVEGGDVVLDACPFDAAVAADARTVCDLHLGLAQGAASSTDVTVQPGTPCRFHLPQELR